MAESAHLALALAEDPTSVAWADLAPVNYANVQVEVSWATFSVYRRMVACIHWVVNGSAGTSVAKHDSPLRILLDVETSCGVTFAAVASTMPAGTGDTQARGIRADGRMAPFGPPRVGTI